MNMQTGLRGKSRQNVYMKTKKMTKTFTHIYIRGPDCTSHSAQALAMAAIFVEMRVRTCAGKFAGMDSHASKTSPSSATLSSLQRMRTEK